MSRFIVLTGKINGKPFAVNVDEIRIIDSHDSDGDVVICLDGFHDAIVVSDSFSDIMKKIGE